MKASMRSNWPGFKNCSWGQVVTEAWILLWCIVCLRFTNDINSIFSPQICSFSIFKSTSNGVSYLALINRFGGLKMRCRWDIRDSLLWAICEDLKFGKFFYSKIFVMCVYESIDAFKLAWVKELVLRSSGNGGVNFIMVHCMFAFYKRYKFYIFSPQICSFSIFKSTSNGVSYLALINRFGGLKMRCSWDIRDSLLWAIC